MNEKPSYYAIIPANVRYDNRLSDKAKLLFGEISSLSDKNGYCYASNKYFSELYNVTQKTISSLVSQLVDLGYVKSEIIYKEGTHEIASRNLSIITGGYGKNFLGGMEKNFHRGMEKNFHRGMEKNVIDNNTSINNTSINNTSINNTSINKEIYKEIVDYLNQKAKTNYRHTSKQTQEKILARLKEKYTLDDFKSVIDKKAKDWLGTEYEKYLCPETLFGNKFEKYLNQKSKDINAPIWLNKEYKKEEMELSEEDYEFIRRFEEGIN